MRFPRELVLLGGAPGAGKGTKFIRKVLGITAHLSWFPNSLRFKEVMLTRSKAAHRSICVCAPPGRK